ncbi:MAG: hypothetical protein LBC07_05675, partial [Elusimicrobiota bacterium]|nr:hypothetical protein [Elusimicrobiota bacterium]
EAQQLLDDYNMLSPQARVAAHILRQGKRSSADKKVVLTLLDRLKMFFIDRHYWAEKLDKALGRTVGTRLADWMNFGSYVPAIISANLYGRNRGAWTVDEAGQARQALDFNYTDLMTMLCGREDDFDTFLVARRVWSMYRRLEQLIREGRDEEAAQLQSVINADGFNRDDINAAYERFREEFARPAAMYDQLNRVGLQWLLAGRIITQARYNELASLENGYAPFKRDKLDEIIGTDESANNNDAPQMNANLGMLRRRRGSRLDILSPLRTARENHARMIIAGTRQLIFNKIGTYARQLPELFLPTTSGGSSYQGSPYDNNLIRVIDVDGRIIYYKVDATFKTAIDRSFTLENRDLLGQALVTAKNIFTLGTTGLYLPFTARNILRDQQTAWVNSQNGFIPIGSTARVFRDLIRGDERVRRFYNEYMTLAANRQTRQGLDDDVSLMINAALQAQSAGRRVIDTIALPNNFIEKLTRFTEYCLARENGKSSVRALEEAGNVSGSFHKIGHWGGTAGKTAVRSIAYFNASIQSTYQLLKSGLRGAGLLAFRKFIAMTAASIAVNLAANFYNDDQEDDDEVMKAINESLPTAMQISMIYIDKKDENGKRGFWRVPMDQLFQLGGVIASMAVQEARGKKDYKGADYADAVAGAVPGNINFGSFRKFTVSLIGLLPQAVQPIMALAFNQKTFPDVMPIVPKPLQSLPSEFQYDEKTSGFAKWAGSKINASPIKIDYLIEGSLGRSARALTHANEYIENPKKSFKNFLGLDFDLNFYGGKVMQDFYDKKEQYTQLKNAIDSGLINPTAKQHRDIALAGVYIKQVDALISNKSKYKKMIDKSPAENKSNVVKANEKMDEKRIPLIYNLNKKIVLPDMK